MRLLGRLTFLLDGNLPQVRFNLAVAISSQLEVRK